MARDDARGRDSQLAVGCWANSASPIVADPDKQGRGLARRYEPSHPP